MALRGLQRATVDPDFILMWEDLDRADRILTSAGYRRHFHSDNVSHYQADPSTLGRIDLLHAFNGVAVRFRPAAPLTPDAVAASAEEVRERVLRCLPAGGRSTSMKAARCSP